MEAIIQCCKRNWYKKLKKLISEKHLSYKDNDKNTLYTICAEHKALDSLKVLCDISMKPIYARNSLGYSALDYSIINKDYEMFHYLTKRGIKVDKKSMSLLKDTKDLSIYYLLDRKKKVVFNKKSLSPKLAVDNTPYANAILSLYEKFREGQHSAIALSSLLVSHYITQIVDIKEYMISEKVREKLKEFKGRSIKSVIQHYTPIIKKSSSQEIIDIFEKSIQWPHMPFVFLEFDKGSCVDLAILKYIYYKNQNKKISASMMKGSNTYISHVEMKESNTNIRNTELLFCLFSFYHIFRSLQLIRYILKKPALENKLIQFALFIIRRIVDDREIERLIRTFLLKRTQETYDSCIKVIREKRKIKVKPKVYMLKNMSHIQTNLKKVFNKVVVRPTSKVLVYRNIGYAVFRNETQSFLNHRYTGTIHKKYLYISYLLKINKNFKDFVSTVLTDLRKKSSLPIYLEVKKSNTYAIKTYEKVGFKHVSSSNTQYLLLYI